MDGCKRCCESNYESAYQKYKEEIDRLNNIINKLLDMPSSTREEKRDLLVYRHILKVQRCMGKYPAVYLTPEGKIEYRKI